MNVKLIDFDISRLYSGKRDRDTTIYGTEGYAAPEQYGFMETQFTADIYSIGALLKLLLNSCPDCPIAREVLLRRIAAKCTRLDPQKRYKSTAAVRRAVSRSRWIIPLVAALLSVSVLTVIFAALNIDSAFRISENIQQQTPPVNTVETTESPAESTTSTSDTTTEDTAPTIDTTKPTTAESRETTLITTQTTTQTTPVKTTQSTTQSTAQSTTSLTTQTTKSTTATISSPSSEPEVIEALEPLHTSDMDNLKIEITTAKNEDGYYQDYFEYQFYDDPTVHGKWNYFGNLLIPNFSVECEIKQYPIENRIFASLNFAENGQASAVLANEPNLPLEYCWTNGYLICEYTEGTAAQRLFTAEIDSGEYLFVELKTGDFSRDNKVYFYEVFARAE